jgi:predicted transcriptional regulator
MGKLADPRIRVEVIQRLACGQSQYSVGKALGISQQNISRFANKEEIKSLIKREQARLVDALPDAIENVKGLIKGMKNIHEHGIKQKELAYKATRDLLRSVGIFPTQTPKTNVLDNDRRQQAILPEVLQMLQRCTEKGENDT